MSASAGPGHHTRAYKGLAKLQANGGRLSANTWTRTMMWAGTFATFLSSVAEPLVSAGLVTHHHDAFIITLKGMAHLGICVDEVAPEAPAVAGPAYIPPRRTLCQQGLGRRPTTREGALDYRDIPSRVGDQYLPHVKKA